MQDTVPNHEIEDWLQSLRDFDPGENAAVNNSSNYASRIGATPGGTIVMDHMLRHGMWAPVETRIFHHIILVSCSALLGIFGIFLIALLAQKMAEFQIEPLVVDVGMNVTYVNIIFSTHSGNFQTAFRSVISHFWPFHSARVSSPSSQQLT